MPFDAPLQLLAHGALLAWPMAAVLLHLGADGPVRSPRDPEPSPLAGWTGYYQAAPADAAAPPEPPRT